MYVERRQGSRKKGGKKERKKEGDIPSSFDVSCFLIPIIDIIPRSISEFTKPFPVPIISIHSFIHPFIELFPSPVFLRNVFWIQRKTGQEGARKRDVQIGKG